MSKVKGKYNIDHVSLEEITITKASIINEKGLNALPKGSELEMNFQLTPSVNIDVKKVKIAFGLTITSYKGKIGGEKTGIVGEFEIAFFFSIGNLEELAVTVEGGLIDLSDMLVGALSNIAYATARGIIYTRCHGTVLGKIILPVLSTAKVLGRELRPE